MQDRRFYKMSGLGNDFVIFDARKEPLAPLPEALVRRIADRRAGPGCDQLLVIGPGAAQSDARMEIYNADGSSSQACGNGARCVAALLMEESGRGNVRLATPGGVAACERAGAAIRADLGRPRFGWHEIPLAGPARDTLLVELPGEAGEAGPFTAVNIGNPHAVFFPEAEERIVLHEAGPRFCRHPIFPEGANISFVRVEGRARLRVRVWERGAGATAACGTAACASLAAAARRGRSRRTARVQLPGGALEIEWRERDDHLLMTGPARFDYAGRICAQGARLTGWRRAR